MKWTVFLVLSTIIFQEVLAQDYKKCSEASPDACGQNASCNDDESNYLYYVHDGAYCECNQGFIGTPPNCTKGCKSDENCNDDEFCIRRINNCKNGCRPYHCPENNYCDLSTRKCTGGCDFDYACPDGSFCDMKIHQCVPGCKSDYECDTTEYCNEDSHQCRKICTDYPCGPNSKCRIKNGKKVCSCRAGFAPRREEGCQKVESTEDRCKNACAEESECKTNKMNVTSCSCSYKSNLDNPFVFCASAPIYTTSTTHSSVLKPTDDVSSISLKTIIVLSG